MFTYNENRVLFVEQGRLEFPCEVTATIELYPSAVYGDPVPGVTCAVGSEARLTWNANTGRSQVESRPPLPAPNVTGTVGTLTLAIVGHAVRATWQCASRDELTGTLGALHFVLPLCLSLEFADPTLPAVTSGRAGSASFVWQVEATRGAFEAVPPEERDGRLRRGLDRVPLLCDDGNVRLLAAAAYFQRATRLIVAGIGPSEFAAEAIVNLAKCLEVLFPARPSETRNAVREGLGQLGYGREAIEGTYVKSLVLRSSLDAAHVRMATLAADERRKLQLYMERVLGKFGDLLRDLAQRAADGTLVLAPYESERTADDELARLLSSL